MNIRFLILWMALGLLAAGGCSKAYETTVSTNSYGSPDFSAFHTFAFSGIKDRGLQIPASDDKSPLRTRVKEMVIEQLVAKGLRQVGLEDSPDLLVHLVFGVNEADKYREGTLVVNLAEPSTRRLVWRAMIRETVGPSLEKNLEAIQKGIAKAFKGYPPDR